MRQITFSLITLFSLALVGCFNLDPKPDNTVIYTLGSDVSSGGASGGQPFYMSRPELPSYLMGNSLVFHTDEGALMAFPLARWGEDLSDGIARALADYLQRDGRVNVRSQYPWPKLSSDAGDIRVLFKRFGATESGSVQVSAVWQIRENGDVMKEGFFKSEGLECDLSEASSYVAELNAGLEQLANQIAEAL